MLFEPLIELSSDYHIQNKNIVLTLVSIRGFLWHYYNIKMDFRILTSLNIFHIIVYCIIEQKCLSFRSLEFLWKRKRNINVIEHGVQCS
jgi:hypothetical protein